MKEIITSDKAPTPVGPYSPGVAIDGWIFLSGQGGFDPETGSMISDDLEKQTVQTFENIKVLLEEAGAGLEDVVSCLVHITDLANFQKFNAIYAEQFGEWKPVRTTVQAALAAGMLVEITVIAKKPS